MKASRFVCGLLALVQAVWAQVEVGENLLVNGRFDGDQVEFPDFWTRSSGEHVLYDRAGGPKGGCAAIILRAEAPLSITLTARQQGLSLVAGETYKLSAFIRTIGFKSEHAGLIVHNSGWIKEVGFNKLPEASEWTFMEKTFTLFPSKDNEYGVAMFAVKPEGEIQFADVKLEAVSEGALKGSKSQSQLLAKPRLVPLRPLLMSIPAGDPRLHFKFFGSLPEPFDAYEYHIGIDGQPIPDQVLPMASARIEVWLRGLARGTYHLCVTLRHKASKESIAEFAHSIRIVTLPEVDRTGLRRLNNLVVEVLNQELQADVPEQSFSFVNPRDGWVFVALNAENVLSGLAVVIDNDTAITAETDRREVFRCLPVGDHRLTVRNAPAGARLVVRSIPEIFDYPPCTNSYVRENGSYDWDFMKKHILYAVTTLNGGRLPGDALSEAKAMGLKWLCNFNVAPVDDPDSVRTRMEAHPGMTDERYDGLTSDELFFGRTSIDNYTKALWSLHNPEGRLIYTWIVGKPSIACLHTDFMSSALNVSGGYGRLNFEAYCHPQPDEASAAAYLENKLVETMVGFNDYFPEATKGTGIIFGNFNQIPIISLEHDPGVDFKYFLDMQVNMVANDPVFQDLATTGYWGTYYGDEEMVRWAFKLMRHYAVEGKKDMLSKQYGFCYNPGFVQNPDFVEGLQGWRVEAAVEDSIRPHTIPGFGKKSQGRWGAGSAGDTACVLHRQEGKANRISQTIIGLTVGKAYCLKFVTADFKDLTEKRYNPHRHGLEATLENAEILPELSYVHIDKRKGGRYKDNHDVAQINLHRIVFRATSESMDLTFTDENVASGTETVLNFVQLKRYLE